MANGTSNTIIMIILFAGLIALTWWSSRKSKKQQEQVKDFRKSLKPGDLVVTIGGVIGKVVSVDTKYEEIVLDSEGSQIRFTFRAISKEYIRPAYVDDDEVDEQGNAVDQGQDAPDESDQTADVKSEGDSTFDGAQKPFDEDSSADQSSADTDTDNDNDAKAEVD